MTPKQQEALDAYNRYGSYQKAATALGIAKTTIQELCRRARAWEADNPGISDALRDVGIKNIGVVQGGWLKTDGASIRFKLDHTTDTVDLAESIKESLEGIIPRPKIDGPRNLPKDLCNFIPLADLHVGGQYGDPKYLPAVIEALERLISSLPPAVKAVLLDMGDLLDANDHHGLTPASGNNCDVIRENHLQNTLDALHIMRYTTERLLETHEEVEVHLLRGNHDETAYIAVMVGLHMYFKDNPRVDVVMTDDDFRVIPWGRCCVFPHHGDKAKWEALKDVFSDQFPDAWAKAKYWRFVWTAHVHHDKQREMIGAVAEHFRTISAPTRWAQLKGLFSRGGIQCITLHKQYGETDRKKVNLEPLLLQDKKPKSIKY